MRRRRVSFSTADFGTRFSVGRHRFTRALRCGSLRNNFLEAARDSLMELWPEHARQMSKIATRNVVLAQSVLEVTGKRVFFDASKHHMIIRNLARHTPIKMKVLHLVRDVRGAAVSDMRHTPGLTLRGAVRRWVQGNRDIERQMTLVPQRDRLRIRYEDLCRDTRATLAKIFRFCAVDAEFVIDSFRREPSCIIGNYMRLSRFAEIRLDERWREVLASEQLQLIRRMAGRLQSGYGYGHREHDRPLDCESRSLRIQPAATAR